MKSFAGNLHFPYDGLRKTNIGTFYQYLFIPYIAINTFNSFLQSIPADCLFYNIRTEYSS